MAIRRSTGYALRTHPLGEADLIVEIFTRERGRIRAVARSARRPRSRFGSAFEPFTMSRFVYFQRDKDDLARLSSADIERSYFEGLADLEPAMVASYCAELIIGFTPQQDPAPTLFRLIGASMDALVSGTDPETVARYVEVWVLRLSGFLPDVHRCGACGRALERDAWVSELTLELICQRDCGEQSARRRLPPPGLALLRSILKHSPGQLGEVPAAAARSLGGATRMLVTGQLERTPRSLRVLSRLRRHRVSEDGV